MTRWIIASLVGLLITIVHLVIFSSSIGDRVEPLSMDLWFNVRGMIQPPDEILVVAMDETSYGVLNVPLSQAWPRALHAELLERLAKAGAKRVIFDVLFLGEGASSESDKALARAIAKVPVGLGIEATIKDYSSSGGSYKIEELLTPFEPFSSNAFAEALVSLPEDYGYIRRFLTERSKITKEYPSLAEVAVGISKHEISSDFPGERDFINYYGPSGTIPTLSYYQVLENDKPLPTEIIKDKIVFVGLVLQTEVGPAQKDIFRTPFGTVFGTEIHATAAANLLQKNWIKRSSGFLEKVILGLLSLVLGTLMVASRPLMGMILLFGSILIWTASSYIGFSNMIFLPGTLLFLGFLPITFLGSTLYYYFVTRRAQLKMQTAFQYYLSPEMAAAVAKDPKALGLGGEKVWATALFTDIAGFSTITEEMPAEKVAAMLNAYFSEVMDVVFSNQGTLIKFIGDAIFGLWGAPIKLNNHAEKAVQTGIEIGKGVERFNQSGRFPPLHTRVGVHTGPMVVGNLGSEKRFDYTAVGDSVNLASRVEGVNKYFGTSILITDTTKKEMGNVFDTVFMGFIQVLGKQEVIGLHTIFVEPVSKDLKDRWLDALQHFKDRKWEQSREAFMTIKSDKRFEKAVDLYLKEISWNEQHPPAARWAGEVRMEGK